MSPEPPLWSPWRLEYILADKTEGGCVFCYDPSEPFDRREALIVHESEVTNVFLNKYPYNSSHLLIIPKRHISTLQELTPVESLELSTLTRVSVEILTSAFKPDGFNIGMNLGRSAGAGITGHIHQHIVPRWAGDNNFMPVISEIHVMPQHILTTYDKLKPYFGEIS